MANRYVPSAESQREATRWKRDLQRRTGFSTKAYPVNNRRLGVSSGDFYEGYFKINKDSDTQVSVIVGYDEDNTYCGAVNLGNDRQLVLKTTLTISQTVVIYIKTTYSGGYVCEIEQAITLPSASNGTDIKLIGVVFFSNGVIESIQQILYGEHSVVRWT